jgi:hypothetical protein
MHYIAFDKGWLFMDVTWGFKAASGIDADIDNYRTTFMCSTMVSVTTTGQRSTPVIAPMDITTS